MSFTCACNQSSSDQRDTEPSSDASEECVPQCPLKSRGPHVVHRKKYAPNELNTAGLQCDYEASSETSSACICVGQAITVQCDLESEDDDDNDDTDSICSNCKCTPGFCPEKCEAHKRELAQKRSDSWPASKSSNIPVPLKRSSAPGLSSPPVDSKPSCRCTKTPCTRDCSKQQQAKEVKPAFSKEKCCACKNGCSVTIQVDMDEAPIAPLAPVPMKGTTPPIQPRTMASNVCISCQCDGTCTVECLLKKEAINSLITKEELGGDAGCCTCKKPDKVAKKTSIICCCEPPEGKHSQVNQTEPAPVVQVCNCETMCKAECDQFKNTQTPPAAPKQDKGTICDLCKCVGECNQACKQSRDAELEKTICKECVCTTLCKHPKCEAARIAARNICEDCSCKGVCKPKCLEKMAKDPCRHLKTEGTTQVNGIIEDFPDAKLIDKAKNESTKLAPKAVSSHNIPLVCDCDQDCSATCKMVRRIQSASEFPPRDVICDECICEKKCTVECLMKKLDTKCVTADGRPIKCDDDDGCDWTPCATCTSDAPCSPVCRERMARAAGTPKKGTGSKTSSNCMCLATSKVQTSKPSTISCEVQPDVNTGSAKSTSALTCMCDAQTFCGSPSCNKLTSCADDNPAEEECAEGKELGPECSMCMKFRAFLCSMFKKDHDQCPCNAAQGDQRSREDDVCPCNQVPCKKTEKAKGQSSPTKQPPCTCSNFTGQERSGSYTDRMQNMMSHIIASCEDAELATAPFIKVASVFQLDERNQQEAIQALLHKCKQKDHYIDALIEDLLLRSDSMVFANLLCRLQEQNFSAPDFDNAIIMSALDTTKSNKPVCGIDLLGFKVISVKRIAPTSLVVKWNPPVDSRVCGYDILVNGLPKTKIENKCTTYAVLDSMDFTATICIDIFAMAPTGRAYPSAQAYYAKY